MTVARTVQPQPIGSDFECPGETHLKSKCETPPWLAGPQQTVFLESGRQALSHLASELWLSGRRRIAIPALFCESMIEPFAAAGFETLFCDVDSGWRAAPLLTLAGAEDVAILSVCYFGVPESDAWVGWLKAMRGAGAVVISDETHRLFSHGLDVADFKIGSFRKLLPVADGAFLTGSQCVPPLNPTSAAADLRWQAMVEKTRVRGQREGSGFYELFRKADALGEVDSTMLRCMSERSEQIVWRLDYQHLAAARVDNAKVIQTRLRGRRFQVTNVEDAMVPSHAVITGPEIRSLRAYLAAKNIFCPIHWERPVEYRTQLPDWPTEILSIPIDHRYGAEEMHRICDAIDDFCIENEMGTST